MVEGVSTCVNDIHLCVLKQDNKFANVYIMILIFTFWCICKFSHNKKIELPCLVTIAKGCMVGKCCLGRSPCNCLYRFLLRATSAKDKFVLELTRKKVTPKKRKRDLWGIIKSSFRNKKLTKVTPMNNGRNTFGNEGDQKCDVLF